MAMPMTGNRKTTRHQTSFCSGGRLDFSTSTRKGYVLACDFEKEEEFQW
jgi:hypothetical protein